ncbi:MAG: hypothetical protein J4N84_09195 [Chloroflexi bacterium]|nr:hypothetical protein [Chloroflexota bacterium]
MEGYYGAPNESMSRIQSLLAAPAGRCAPWLQDFISAGAQTVVIRFGGPDQTGQLERCARDVLPLVHDA